MEIRRQQTLLGRLSGRAARQKSNVRKDVACTGCKQWAASSQKHAADQKAQRYPPLANRRTQVGHDMSRRLEEDHNASWNEQRHCSATAWRPVDAVYQ